MKITAHKSIPDLNLFLSPVSSCQGVGPDDLLNWLVFSASTLTSSVTKVAWDIDQFAKSVVVRLPRDIADGLSSPPHRVKFGNYKLFYVPEKVFSVEKNGSVADFYDLSQYFPGEREPETITGLQEKADELERTLSELGIDNPPSLASPLACFREHGLLKSLDGAFPSIFDLPDEWLDAQELALSCTPREWTSNYKIGHFSELWKYDISSAYPFSASVLPDLRDCRLKKADGADILADAGFLIGDFTVYPGHPLAFCSPFLVDRGDGVEINFVGTERDYKCTLDDVRTLYRYRMGGFQFKSGWLVYWDSPRFPFARIMRELYGLRGDNPLRSHLLKRVMNGIVGKLLETRKDGDGCVLEYGDNYNPIYHAMITNPVRLRVFDALADWAITQDELVHIGVDGFRAARRLPLPGSAPIGGWRCAGSESAFVLSPGAIVSPDRSYKSTGYDDLLSECEKRSTAYLLGKDRSDPINVRRLHLRQTRGFGKMPKNAGDLLGVFESEPVNLRRC